LPAVSPLPYIFVWLLLEDAHVQCRELLLGCTPALFDVSADVLGVPVQPLNLAPPGVSFDVALAAVFDCACAVAFACACADAFALGPAADVDAEVSSDFFAWPLFSTGADVDAEAETLALVEACAAWPGGVPCGLSAQATDPVSALINAAKNAAPRARLFIVVVSFRIQIP
jgi:hypothetical protein